MFSSTLSLGLQSRRPMWSPGKRRLLGGKCIPWLDGEWFLKVAGRRYCSWREVHDASRLPQSTVVCIEDADLSTNSQLHCAEVKLKSVTQTINGDSLLSKNKLCLFKYVLCSSEAEYKLWRQSPVLVCATLWNFLLTVGSASVCRQVGNLLVTTAIIRWF